MNQHITSIQNYTHFVPIRTKENLIMFVNPNDQYISRSLMYSGQWEPHIVSIFNQYIKNLKFYQDSLVFSFKASFTKSSISSLQRPCRLTIQENSSKS